MLFKASIIKDHHSDLGSSHKPAHVIVIHFLHVPEPLRCKVVPDELKEMDLLHKEGILVLFCLAGKGEAFVSWNRGMVIPVLIKTGELPPVDFPVLVRLAVEHVRVNPAYRKPVVVYPAHPILEKPTRSFVIVFRPEGISGNIEYAVLVAELRSGGGFKSSLVDRSYRSNVTVEEKYMAVKFPCAALRAGRTGKTDISYNLGKEFQGILKETIALLRKCNYA